MKISRNWLSDFIEWKETDPMVIADTMTRCMGEVDEVEQQGQYLDGCVVGRVQTIQKHPSADRLHVCHVQTNDGTKQVVCGGTNLREGMFVAFAHVGATVKWHGGETMTLSKVKLRGVESEGMICAAEEIGLEAVYAALKDDGERPIIDLSRLTAQSSHLRQGYGGQAHLKAGEPLRTVLGMNDVIFRIDNHAITNRPDLFSHIGIARELVAMGIAEWKKDATKQKITFPKTACTVTSINDIPLLIPRYAACTLRVDGPGTTPLWMKQRLEATGWRSINLAVDITNYVAMEQGMPLHCFDADDISGVIRMRTATKNETITTLDGIERSLPDGAIVLSDDAGIFDLLGIMGGLRSSTKDTSRNLYLHAAIVDPASIRKAIIGTGHRTDASTVYEKGIPFDAVERGFMRALELILALMPGATITSAKESWGKDTPKKPITIPTEMFSSYIGAPMKVSEIKNVLTDLGFTHKTSGKNLVVTPPAWRNDVTMKQDLVEEVARIYGYAKVTPVMPEASITPPPRDQRINALRSALKEATFIELLHLAFSNAGVMQKCKLSPLEAISIANPLGEELSLMRTSLLPAMLETIEKQLKTFDGMHLKTFEYGRVFTKGKSESLELCAVVAAKEKTTLANDPSLILKADITQACSALGYDLRFTQATNSVAPFAHGGRSAVMSVGTTTVGFLTELHPSVRASFGLHHRTSVAILHLDLVKSITPTTLVVAPLSAFPAVEFDETIILGNTPHAAIIRKAKATDLLLTDVRTLHFYEGNGVKNVTLRFTYRADDRTLVQGDIEKVHAKVMEEIKKDGR